MKVYAVLEHNWQDYEGGGAELVKIFANKERAIAFIEMTYGDSYTPSETEENRWDTKDDIPAAESWISIQTEDVVN